MSETSGEIGLQLDSRGATLGLAKAEGRGASTPPAFLDTEPTEEAAMPSRNYCTPAASPQAPAAPAHAALIGGGA
jgi:hypothetical protein